MKKAGITRMIYSSYNNPARSYNAAGFSFLFDGEIVNLQRVRPCGRGKQQSCVQRAFGRSKLLRSGSKRFARSKGLRPFNAAELRVKLLRSGSKRSARSMQQSCVQEAFGRSRFKALRACKGLKRGERDV